MSIDSNTIPIQIQGNLPPAPRTSAGCAPLRRANSVRRTSTVDATWPEGRGKAMAFDARARDVLTTSIDSAPQVLALDRVTATIAVDRSIAAIDADPARAGISRLVGARGGGYLRRALEESLPDERDAGTPLYLLLDDFAGVSLIGGWAWRHWDDAPETGKKLYGVGPTQMAERLAKMEDICSGFAPGSNALRDVAGTLQNFAPVVPLPNPADPAGWHELPSTEGVTMRRARRIDVWRDTETIHVDAMFQDSASVPEGGRKAVHEYTLQAQIDAITLKLIGVQAQPRILPYPECPSAVGHLSRLIGAPVRELRALVLEQLPKSLGCTHLNDALRALAEVPLLVQELKR